MGMTTQDLIAHVAANFSRIYLGGVPSLLNDDGAFLSFICSLTAIEALGGFLSPKAGNGERFRVFVQRYFPEPHPAQSDSLWNCETPRYTASHRARTVLPITTVTCT
jgi:hypothetical protein